MVEWYWQGKMESNGGNSVPMPLYHLQFTKKRTTCNILIGSFNKWVLIPDDLFCNNGLIVIVPLNEEVAKYGPCTPPPLSLHRYASCRLHSTHCYPAVCNNTIIHPLLRHTNFIFDNHCIKYYVFGVKRGCIICPFPTHFMVQFPRPPKFLIKTKSRKSSNDCHKERPI
jgi:hypothetical protein